MNTFTHTIKRLSVGTLALALFAVASPAWAASLNTHPSDLPTLTTKVHTGQNNSGWSTSASADPGDTVAFAIYYHNNSNETAQDVRVRFTPSNTGVGTSHNFTAYVWADNASQVNGSVTVHISGSEDMDFQNGSVVWRPDQQVSTSDPLPFGQNGDEIFTSNGLRLGDIEPGFSHQGNVVLNFTVSGDNGVSGREPDVETLSATEVDDDSARLRCEVDPNGSYTTAWFEWGEDDNSLNEETSHVGIGSSDTEEFTRYIDDLDRDERYYFRCVAENDEGTEYGDIRNFRTGEDGDERPEVQTQSARNITNTSAQIRGLVDSRNDSAEYWFEWGITPSSLNRDTTHRYVDGVRSVDANLLALAPNTTYYYRIVAENRWGVDIGNILTFTTTGGGTTSDKSEAVTNVATNVGQTSARLNGVALTKGVNTTAWFQWGRMQSLGNTTTNQNVGSAASVNYYQSLFGLSPNTTYYFRAVAQNGNGTDYGSILSFRTNSAVTPPSGPTTPDVREADIEKSIENLTNPNGTRTRVDALRGDTLRFTIEVENTGDLTLADVDIRDRVPDFLEFANAEEVNINNPQREVVWFVGDMRPGERELVTLDVVLTDDAPLGIAIDNVARIESDKLTRNSNVVTIRTTDRIGVSGDGAAATIFGGGFFPDTLLGWLLLIILILILIVLIRLLAGYWHERKERAEAQKQEATPAPAAGYYSGGGSSTPPGNLPH